MTARNLLAPLMLIASFTACTASPADRLAGVLPDERVLINMPTQSASAKAAGEEIVMEPAFGRLTGLAVQQFLAGLPQPLGKGGY